MKLFPADIEALARCVVEALAARQQMVATAESCTGGLIAAALTAIAGSSAAVDRGFVTYSNEAKRDLVGVAEATLARFGAVSRQTALEMAQGALSGSHGAFSVAVTGIAGPGGATAQKPVGLVHLAAQSRDGRLLHREMRYGAIGRDEIRLATVKTALEMLVSLIQAG